MKAKNLGWRFRDVSLNADRIWSTYDEGTPVRRHNSSISQDCTPPRLSSLHVFHDKLSSLSSCREIGQ